MPETTEEQSGDYALMWPHRWTSFHQFQNMHSCRGRNSIH